MLRGKIISLFFLYIYGYIIAVECSVFSFNLLKEYFQRYLYKVVNKLCRLDTSHVSSTKSGLRSRLRCLTSGISTPIYVDKKMSEALVYAYVLCNLLPRCNRKPWFYFVFQTGGNLKCFMWNVSKTINIKTKYLQETKVCSFPDKRIIF